MLEPGNTLVKAIQTAMQYRRLLFWNLLSCFLVCIALLLLQPRQYSARITLLPVLAADAGPLSSIPAPIFELCNLGERFTARACAILQSRTLKEEIVKELQLMKAYGTNGVQKRSGNWAKQQKL
jgi:uncharacterized protein involved in exopolysaccharide biosynthesis